MSDVETGVALVVDLDGTLTPADISLESLVRFARQRPFNIILLCFWLLRGRAFVKTLVARHAPVDPSLVPIRPEIAALIEQARNQGRAIILASGSHARNVRRMAAHTGLFDISLGTTARTNLTGSRKLMALRERLGDRPFDYAGDSRADVPLWDAARQSYTTGLQPDESVTRLAGRPDRLRALLKTLRLHQWAKNALVFVPVATAGLIAEPQALAAAALAALFFSLVASAIYQFNDMLDIEADRAHPKKKLRPLAAGTLSLPLAGGVALLLLAAAFAGALMTLPPGFALVLLGYLVLTTAYSVWLKSVMTLDVITLGCLYTMRLIAGAVAVGVTISFWLLFFSLFFFLSLGYLKRYTELAFAPDVHSLIKGRGYVGSDIDFVASAGISSGMVSILIMGLYVNDMKKTGIYAAPDLLWGLCLGLLYWINRIWIMARRGEVDGDPVAFALRDRRSIVIALVMGAVFLAARYLPLG